MPYLPETHPSLLPVDPLPLHPNRLSFEALTCISACKIYLHAELQGAEEVIP